MDNIPVQRKLPSPVQPNLKRDRKNPQSGPIQREVTQSTAPNRTTKSNSPQQPAVQAQTQANKAERQKVMEQKTTLYEEFRTSVESYQNIMKQLENINTLIITSKQKHRFSILIPKINEYIQAIQRLFYLFGMQLPNIDNLKKIVTKLNTLSKELSSSTQELSLLIQELEKVSSHIAEVQEKKDPYELLAINNCVSEVKKANELLSIIANEQKAFASRISGLELTQEQIVAISDTHNQVDDIVEKLEKIFITFNATIESANETQLIELHSYIKKLIVDRLQQALSEYSKLSSEIVPGYLEQELEALRAEWGSGTDTSANLGNSSGILDEFELMEISETEDITESQVNPAPQEPAPSYRQRFWHLIGYPIETAPVDNTNTQETKTEPEK